MNLLSGPKQALIAGIVVAAVMLVAVLAMQDSDAIGLVSFLLRLVHVIAAAIWIGMIWFVNLIQLRAVQEADDAGRAALMRLVVPRVAHAFRHTSHLTVLSGILLLVPAGYVLGTLVYGSPVHVGTPRAFVLWAGVVGGLAMWALVHMAIWPSLRIVLGETPGDADAKTAARARVALYARVNLLLTIPVVFSMVAAAHLN